MHILVNGNGAVFKIRLNRGRSLVWSVSSLVFIKKRGHKIEVFVPSEAILNLILLLLYHFNDLSVHFQKIEAGRKRRKIYIAANTF